MHALIDNTFMHLVGDALESPRGEMSMRVVLFHLAEHIMFDDEMTVSISPAAKMYPRTSAVLQDLMNKGILEEGGRSLIRLHAFDLARHEEACTEAAAELARLLNLRQPGVLESWSGIAKQWLMMIDFPGLLAAGSEPVSLTSLVAEHRDVPTAEVDYMLRISPSLRTEVQALVGGLHGMSTEMQATLSALFRLYINQALSGTALENGIYAPPPQRVALAREVNRLHDLARAEARKLHSARGDVTVANPDLLKTAHSILNDELSRVLLETGRAARTTLPSEVLDQFPLPLLAIHLMRSTGQNPKGPYGILEQARKARDSEEARRMRTSLSRWQNALLNPVTQDEAQREIQAVSDEVKARLGGGTAAPTASIRFNVKLLPPAIELSLPEFDVNVRGLRAMVAWFYHRRFQRQILLSVARDMSQPGKFARWFDQAISW